MSRKSISRVGSQAFCVACLLMASQAEAARQGSLGAVSTGTVGISASIAPKARMSGSGDIRFGDAAAVSQSLCLSSNSRAGSYTVATIGSGNAGRFELSNGGEPISYTVNLAPSERGQSGSGTGTAQLRAASLGAECRFGRGSAALVVAIDSAHFDRAGTQVYTGALTVIVAPD